jgi:hypothetical protein
MILTMGRNHMGVSWTYFRYGDVAGANSTMQFGYATDASAALYTAAPTTVCLDVGEIDGHARVVFWATGANAADCDDWSTLTLTNALYDSNTDAATGSIWSGLVARDLVDYVKASNGTATFGDVVVFREAAAL